MPTNLPPEADEAEKRYRAATSLAERIVRLEQWISAIPKHKGTDHLRADLRRRLSELKAETQESKGASRHESAYRIPREGAGQVVVLGPPNVGKSALVATLTHATPEVADYPYTTWEPTPGMMKYKDVPIQLIDTPPLDREHVEGELLDLLRRADLLLLVVDLQTDPDRQLVDTLTILRENGILPCRPDSEPGQGAPGTCKRLLVAANKADDPATEELVELFHELCAEHRDSVPPLGGWSCVPISVVAGRNLERLKKAVFEALEIIRVYAKPPGKPPDMTAPFILKRGSTVEELAAKVHRDFIEKLAAARVWGSAEFDGQMVQRDHVLQDGDVVELRI
jgi:ribosome-interacting GTPase 1